MVTIDAAIEDYLHLIVRTRPWTKKREEELLNGYCEWLYAHPHTPRNLAALEPECVEHYMDCLPDPQRHAFHGVLQHFAQWAERNGLIAANPFAHIASA